MPARHFLQLCQAYACNYLKVGYPGVEPEPFGSQNRRASFCTSTRIFHLTDQRKPIKLSRSFVSKMTPQPTGGLATSTAASSQILAAGQRKKTRCRTLRHRVFLMIQKKDLDAVSQHTRSDRRSLRRQAGLLQTFGSLCWS